MQIVNLTLLAAEIQEKIISLPWFGAERESNYEGNSRRVSLAVEWGDQRQVCKRLRVLLTSPAS